MKPYKLTLKDKIYLFFHEDYDKRVFYLYPKVFVHQLKWYNENRLRIPLDYDRYINNYIDSLIFEYDLKR